MTIDVQIKKAKEKLNKFVNSIWFVIVIGIIILLKTILFYNNTIAINENIELETIIGTISFIVVIGCFLCVLPNRPRVIVTILVDLLLSIMLFSDNIYYTYSNSVLSIAQFSNLQYGE